MIRKVVIALLILTVIIGANMCEHRLRLRAQRSETLYYVMVNVDFFEFFSGGSLNCRNIYAYHYFKWLGSNQRTWWQKILFWDFGVGVLAEYPYLFLGND